MSELVALVLVSHSAALAEGTRELAQQMAPEVPIFVAGGGPDGGLGTSLPDAQAAVKAAQAASGDAGVVVLADLGSAHMVAQLAAESASEPARLQVPECPFVEGTAAAAVASQSGFPLVRVAHAANVAGKQWAGSAVDAAFGALDVDRATMVLDSDAPRARARVGGTAVLHARSAAEFARLAAHFDAEVFIDGVDAKSVLEVVSLGARPGQSMLVAAAGPEAEQAVSALCDALRAGFDPK